MSDFFIIFLSIFIVRESVQEGVHVHETNRHLLFCCHLTLKKDTLFFNTCIFSVKKRVVFRIQVEAFSY